MTLAEFRAKRRLQELVFDLAAALTREYLAQGRCEVASHVLFPQLAKIVQRYVDEKVIVYPPAPRIAEPVLSLVRLTTVGLLPAAIREGSPAT